MSGGASVSPAEVVPGADAVAEGSHWTGVACGGFFEVVLFFEVELSYTHLLRHPTIG